LLFQLDSQKISHMKKVILFGTFDILHPGHINLFQQAKKFGEINVVIARDKNVKKIKQRLPQNNERSRLGKVAHLPEIHKAFLGNLENFFQPIEKIQPDIIVLGFDQKTFSTHELKTNLKKRNLFPKIIRLKSYKPKIFKSSLIRKSYRQKI
jgi:FAD synthetase